METIVIGLGRMGLSVALRLQSCGKIFGYDVAQEPRAKAELRGLPVFVTLQEIARSPKQGPITFWMMVPAGNSIDALLEELPLQSGDIVIDGGNSNYKDSVKRGEKLASRGVHFLDAGVSGGVHGEKNGFCVMVGGETSVYQQCEALFKAVACPGGYRYIGPSGSGHYVKMVHNAMEYGLLQVLGEGFWLLEEAPYDLNLHALASLWNQGSVIRSWLLELVEKALEKPETLEELTGKIGGGETGRWALEESIARNVPMPLITQAYLERVGSHYAEPYSNKIVAALRREFGGHAVTKKGD